MSSDSDSYTTRGESVALHSPLLHSNSPIHQQVMNSLIPDSPQSDHLQDFGMEEIHPENSQEVSIDSQSSVRFSSEENITEPGFDSQDQSVQQPTFLPGSHAANECDCFDPVSLIEDEPESNFSAQSVHLENMILFRDEASPGFLEEEIEQTSDSSDYEPARPLRRVELGHESNRNLADPTLLTPRTLWRYVHGEVDALGNPRSPTSIELHKLRRINPNSLSSDSSTSSEEEERSIRELLIPADHSLNRSRSIDTESSLEYLPAIDSESNLQDQSIQSRPPTPGPGWSDGISNEHIPYINPNGEPIEEKISSSQEQPQLCSYGEKPDINPNDEPMEEEIPSSQEQSLLSSYDEKPHINSEDEHMEEEVPSSQEQYRFLSFEENEKIGIRIFDSRGSPLTNDSSEGEELSSTQNRSDLHQYARLVERQATPGPSNQQNLNSGNPCSLSPETLRLWRLGFVDARGRRSTQSMRYSSPSLGPSSRGISVHNDVGESNIVTNPPRRDEVHAPTQDLQTTTASKPKGKKRTNQADDSTLPAKKKSRTKQVKISQPSKKREETQAQLANDSCTISPPAIPPTPSQPKDQAIPSSQTISPPALPPTPPKIQDQPSTVSRIESQPVRPQTPPEPQAQAEIQMESRAQRPVRALRPRRLDGRAATNLRSRAFDEGINSNQNKKKRGGEKLKTEIKEEEKKEEPRNGSETSFSRNLNTAENQEVVENTQSEAASPRPVRRLILRLRPPVNHVEDQAVVNDQAQEEVVEEPQPEVQVTEPSRPRRFLRVRSPSNPVNRI